MTAPPPAGPLLSAASPGEPPAAAEAEPTAAAEPGLGRRALASLRRDPVALIAVLLVIALALVAVFAPLLAPYDPLKAYSNGLSADGAPVSPGSAFLLGTDPNGRDVLSRMIFGARVSLLVGVVATGLASLIGVLVGGIAGYAGGITDSVLSRFMDVMFAFPSLVFMIALTALVPDSLPRVLVVVAVIAVFGWTAIARVVRGQTLSLVNREFVLAARSLGADWRWILFRELLPNLASTVIVFASLSVPAAVGTEAALSFLGVGIPPPAPDLGRSISDAIVWVQADPMFLLFPAGLLFAAVLGFNLFGDGLRDALDPRTDRMVWTGRPGR